MSHAINIKFGEVNNLGYARYAAGLGATFLGYNLSPTHPNYVTPEKLVEISGWAAGPTIVTEWENELAEIISDTCKRLELEYVQLNQFNPDINKALGSDFCIIQNFIISSSEPFSHIIGRISQIQGHAQYFMLSFGTPGDQKAFMEKEGHRLLLCDLCRDYPVLLNFYFTTENIGTYINEFLPFGINLKGSQEIKPGYNDFSELEDLLAVLSPED